METEQAVKTIPYCMDAFQILNERRPEEPILFDPEHPDGLTRAEADALSGRVYAFLKKNGVGREDFVLIALPRGVLPFIAMIGVWKAGAAFVAAEENTPPERLEFVQRDCGCRLVIDKDAWQRILEEAPRAGYEATDDHDAAFAIYTSGSTGTPKGVLHEYGGLRQHCLGAVRAPEADAAETTRTAMLSPFNTIAAVKILLDNLYRSACQYIVPFDVSRNTERLKAYFRDNRIDVVFLPPSLLRVLGDGLGPYPKYISTGSEAADGLFLPNVRLENGYAMSECTYTLCRFPIDRAYDRCPIGKPNPQGAPLRLLDPDGNEVPDGEIGEICFENPFMRGYIHQPEATARAFRGGLFHSGDLARKDADGNFCLVGRADDMVKINGNRVEPAEIEAAFRKAAGKDWCAVRGFDSPERSYVCLYYQGELPCGETALQEAMRAELPNYMIPAHFVRLERIPLLPSGKLDRMGLPAPELAEVRPAYVPPRTETERKLCLAFEAAFGVAPIGIHDDFHQLGGDSLRSIEIVTAAELETLSVVDVFDGRTPEGIAALCAQKAREAEEEDLEALAQEMKNADHLLLPSDPSASKRILLSANANAGAIEFHMDRLFRFGPETDADRLCAALNAALANRPGLSMVFRIMEDGQLASRYDAARIPHAEVQRVTEAEFEALRPTLRQPFTLLGKPLVHAGLYATERGGYLYLDICHIITDAVSYSLLTDDLIRAYRGEPLQPDTYFAYVGRRNRAIGSERSRRVEAYYARQYSSGDWCTRFEPDVVPSRRDMFVAPSGRTLDVKGIDALENRTGVSKNVFFIAVTLLALAKVEHRRKCLLLYSLHNRMDNVSRNAFGILWRVMPIGVTMRERESVGTFLREAAAIIRENIANSSFIADIHYDLPLLKQNGGDLLFAEYVPSDAALAGRLKGIGLEPEKKREEEGITTRYSVTMIAAETPQGVAPTVWINSEVYSEEKRERIVRAFSELIERLLSIESPDEVMLDDLLS